MKPNHRKGGLVVILLAALLAILSPLQAQAAGFYDRTNGTPTPFTAALTQASFERPASKPLAHQTVIYTEGTGGGQAKPDQILPDGTTITFTEYPASILKGPVDGSLTGPVAYGKSRDIGIQAALEKAAALPPTEECVFTGHSQGGDVAIESAREAVESGVCETAKAVVTGAPNGVGSFADVVPDIPLLGIEFSDVKPLPEDASAYRFVLEGDCWSSTPNFIEHPASIVTCIAGMGYHYGTFGPGTTYGDFNGEIETSVVGNETYYVGQTRNATEILAENIVRTFDPNFSITPEQSALINQVAPQGTPGVESDLPTPRDILQPDLSLESLPAPLEIADALPDVNEQFNQIVEPLQTWADEIVSDVTETWTQQTPAYMADEPVYSAPDMSYDTPAAPVVDFAATATNMVNDVVSSGAVSADLGTQLQTSVNNLTSMFGGV